MAKNLPAGLETKSNGVYRVRKIVPIDLRDIVGQKDLSVSLEWDGKPCRDLSIALKLHPPIWLRFNKIINDARAGFRSSDQFFEQFEDTDFKSGLTAEPVQSATRALHRAMQSYLFEHNNSLELMKSEKAREAVADNFNMALYSSDGLRVGFEKFLSETKVMLPPESTIRDALFEQFCELSKGLLARDRKLSLRVEAEQQVKNIADIDDSVFEAVARATIRNYDQPKSKPMMKLSAWFAVYVSKKPNIKGLTPDQVREREAKGENVLDHEKVKDMETRQKHDNALEALIDVIGDKPLNHIIRDDAIRFVEMLNDLPTTMKPEVKAMSFTKRIEWSRANPTATKATEATIDKWIGRIKAVWKKAILTYRHEYPDLYQIWDDMDEFIIGRKGQKKRPFKPREIKAIFNAPMFKGFAGTADKDGYRNKAGSTFAQDHNWWLFVLCAHHGNRLSEYARRTVDDLVRDEDGVLYLKIEEAKNDGSKRRLPIHQFCIDMGFEGYVQKVKAAGHTQLFPQLADVSETREQSDHFSQWAGRWFRENGFDFDDPIDGKATFACWRHTFSTVATATDGPNAACLSESQAGHITGHAQGDVQKRVYIQPSNATMKANLDRVWLEGFPYDDFHALYAGGKWNTI